jgi:hypothetical protein
MGTAPFHQRRGEHPTKYLGNSSPAFVANAPLTWCHRGRSGLRAGGARVYYRRRIIDVLMRVVRHRGMLHVAFLSVCSTSLRSLHSERLTGCSQPEAADTHPINSCC